MRIFPWSRRWRCDRTRYGADMVAEVRELARTRTDRQVAEHLNEQGRLSITGKPFSGNMIKWIRKKHHIPGPNPKGRERADGARGRRAFRDQGGHGLLLD